MRISQNLYFNKKLNLGYDYEKQAWVLDGRYLRCGHHGLLNCNCFGKLHEGEKVKGKYALLKRAG